MISLDHALKFVLNTWILCYMFAYEYGIYLLKDFSSSTLILNFFHSKLCAITMKILYLYQSHHMFSWSSNRSIWKWMNFKFFLFCLFCFLFLFFVFCFGFFAYFLPPYMKYNSHSTRPTIHFLWLTCTISCHCQ